MQFGNNIEKFGFEKSTWPMVLISPNGCEIYRGRPSKSDAFPDEPVWFIQHIVIVTGKDGSQVIETRSTDGFKYKWEDRETLKYYLK